jgi:hypothetical protein
LQQRFCREAHQGTGFERGAVVFAGDFVHQVPDKYLHGVQRALGSEDAGAARVELVLREQVGHQRKRQRMAVGEVEDGLVLLGRHRAPQQVAAAFLGAEVAQRQRPQQALPARVHLPRHTRSLAPREDHDATVGQLRQKRLAQPAVQRR